MSRETPAQAYDACRALLNIIFAPEHKALLFGAGSARPQLCIVAESPTGQELQTMVPFASRQESVRALCTELNIDPSEVYLTYVVPFRSVSRRGGRLCTRPPSREEIGLCAPFLRRALTSLRPPRIVTWGATALRVLHPGGWGISLQGCPTALTLPSGVVLLPRQAPGAKIMDGSTSLGLSE